ncbi:polysaccharide biosynthesis protein [Candidatus Venteria ishoeyi]|uniref:UDP-N-acetyl-alpha-D-glucosamine C6 dehydratase n=1 Tax=Candidatus Venteria ishoeyi TaxID=1899563 RepID=A0A1H6FGD9_9GAMM|nr:nucleoside-diphosphate sugar epimerase/dehydratase [Candidatus Venteria ishoeyi]SEH08409.1 UDP-N-acetyl-alpha-D-glucosamine C6 dehydratase [Candidatus Venteria ishoeyi]
MLPTFDIRRVAIVIHDLFMVLCAWLLSLFVYHNFQFSIEDLSLLHNTLPVVFLVQGLILWLGGLYQGLWRFASMPDLWNIIRSVTLGTLLIVLVLYFMYGTEHIPVKLLLIYPLLLGFLLGMPRLLYRLWREQSIQFLLERKPHQRVLIIGAGRSGEMLVRDMRRDREYLPVAFLDDQARLHGLRLHGVPVLTGIERLPGVTRKLAIDLIVIAMPSASDMQMRRIVEYCEKTQVTFRTLPKIGDMANHKASLATLQEVSIEDLLGREKIRLDWDIIQSGVADKVVMVTGGGGSIGSELCRQILRVQPKALVVFEQSEFNLYQVERSLLALDTTIPLHLCLGDVCDPVAVEHAMQNWQPEIIFHAAAYKHVPMLQGQIREAIRNNILGTQILADIAACSGCETFVMISTDKAVNPTNIMGASKRVSELYCQALNKRSDTRFITVRFGNVLGSAGSVVPLFREQITQGGPVTVTDPEISRYFMTIPEACQLILQASAMGHGGEIFVLDMGMPVKIAYLAEQLIRLSGKQPDKDIKIVYTGLRPGEKLHEELFHDEEEQMSRTSHHKIRLAAHRAADWEQLQQIFKAFESACQCYDIPAFRAGLKTLVPEFQEQD